MAKHDSRTRDTGDLSPLGVELRSALLTPVEVAEILQIPIRTLYAWRHHREGPPAIKVGRHLRYSSSALAAWLEAKSQADPMFSPDERQAWRSR